MQVIVIAIVFVILGVILGLLSPVTIPITYARYTAVALLAPLIPFSERSRPTSRGHSNRACSSAA